MTLIFTILMFLIFGKLLMLSFKMAWGLTKILCTLVLLPFMLIFLVIGGLFYLALPILLIVGVVSWISGSRA